MKDTLSVATSLKITKTKDTHGILTGVVFHLSHGGGTQMLRGGNGASGGCQAKRMKKLGGRYQSNER